MAKFFERNSTKLTISEFYDNYKMSKYNFDASYQRKSDVWSEDKKSFLIDSIFKNYPIPAIFMRPIVDEDGRTKYDIVDGKQRLQSIIGFIEGNINLTSYFAEDSFLNENDHEIAISMSDKTFDIIKSLEDTSDYIKQFWTYTLQIEYLYEEDLDLVSTVFDRLNRNGEPLNSQELRNAKYSNTLIMQVIQRLVQNNYLNDKLNRLKIERMEDEEFVSELLFLVLENKFLDSTPDVIDEKYEKYKDDNSNLIKGENEFIQIINFIDCLELDYNEKKRLCWTTHLYTLFSVGWYCINNNIPLDSIKDSVLDFYNSYFSKKVQYIGFLKDYKEGASSRTRSASQRNKRMYAILKYCNIT